MQEKSSTKKNCQGRPREGDHSEGGKGSVINRLCFWHSLPLVLSISLACMLFFSLRLQNYDLVNSLNIVRPILIRTSVFMLDFHTQANFA